MDSLAIFSATLGLSAPWQITEITFAKGQGRLDITVSANDGSVPPCPRCGISGSQFSEDESESWVNPNFFGHETYLHANFPSLRCLCGNIFTFERPWSRAGSKFQLLTRN